MFKVFKKLKVTFTLRSGQKVSLVCKDFKITQEGNTLTGYTATEIDKRVEDSMFYIRLDSVDHIKCKRVFW